MFESGCKFQDGSTVLPNLAGEPQERETVKCSFCNLNNIFVDTSKRLPDNCSHNWLSVLQQKDTFPFSTQ